MNTAKTVQKVYLLSVVNISLIILLVAFGKCFSNIQLTVVVVWGYYIFLITLLIGKVISDNIDIVDITIAFFLMYCIFGCLMFSAPELTKDLQQFADIELNVDNTGLIKYFSVMVISTVPYSYLLIQNIKEPSNIVKSKIYKKDVAFNHGGNWCEILLVCFIVILMILYYYTDGVYIWYSNITNAAKVFNYISWIAILISGLVPMAHLDYDYKQKKGFLLLAIGVVIMYWKLKIRMYCALFLLGILINLHLRGMVIKRKHFLLMIPLLGVFLMGNIWRFESYKFGNFTNDIFSVFGEFFLPNISAYYLINNPLNYDGGFRFLDLLSQLLPSALRPQASLYKFAEFYISNGQNPWPVGGIAFQGQMYYYFGFFFEMAFIIVAFYLNAVRKNLVQRRRSILVACFPLFCMIMPRMEVWTLRSMLFAGIVYYIMRFDI